MSVCIDLPTRNGSAETTIADLADDNLLVIWENLSAQDLCTVGSVCKRWHELSSRDDVWLRFHLEEQNASPTNIKRRFLKRTRKKYSKLYRSRRNQDIFRFHKLGTISFDLLVPIYVVSSFALLLLHLYDVAHITAFWAFFPILLMGLHFSWNLISITHFVLTKEDEAPDSFTTSNFIVESFLADLTSRFARGSFYVISLSVLAFIFLMAAKLYDVTHTSLPWLAVAAPLWLALATLLLVLLSGCGRCVPLSHTTASQGQHFRVLCVMYTAALLLFSVLLPLLLDGRLVLNAFLIYLPLLLADVVLLLAALTSALVRIPLVVFRSLSWFRLSFGQLCACVAVGGFLGATEFQLMARAANLFTPPVSYAIVFCPLYPLAVLLLGAGFVLGGYTCVTGVRDF